MGMGDKATQMLVDIFYEDLWNSPSFVPTEDEAREAKDHLRYQLAQPAWLRGIGITSINEVPHIQVNVVTLTDEIDAAIPHKFRGVHVHIKVVGEVEAQSPYQGDSVPKKRATPLRMWDKGIHMTMKAAEWISHLWRYYP